MLKEKQLEIINKVIEAVNTKFPQAMATLGDVSFIHSNETWADILISEKLIEENETLDQFIALRCNDILMNHGHLIIFLTIPKRKLGVA